MAIFPFGYGRLHTEHTAHHNQGEWGISVGEKWKDLERHEGRSTVFSEQCYSLNMPTQGEALDVAALDDGTLYVITTNPVTLHWIEPAHHKVASLDLSNIFFYREASIALMLGSLLKINNSSSSVTHRGGASR